MAARKTLNFSLYVGNLPWTIGTAELKNYFAKFGEVGYCHLLFNELGMSKGCGFIGFRTQEALNAVFQKFDHELEGNKLIIKQKFRPPFFDDK